MKIKPWRNGARYRKQARRLGWLQAAVINIGSIHGNPFGAGGCPQFLLMPSKHAAGEGNHGTATHCSVPGAGNLWAMLVTSWAACRVPRLGLCPELGQWVFCLPVSSQPSNSGCRRSSCCKHTRFCVRAITFFTCILWKLCWIVATVTCWW